METEGSKTGERFPIETLPETLRQFVTECAAALPASPDLIVIPVLVTVGAAIGNSRRIRLKGGWEESSAIYGAVVAETGSMKSPVLKLATAPLTTDQPSHRSTWTTDVTVEALGALLQQYPKGVLLTRDELTRWVKSLNQYRSGKGADREFYLSAWSGSSIKVVRRGNKTIKVQTPFLAVVGCIPPDLVPSLSEKNGEEDGFMPRILFAWPDPVPVRWTEQSVPEAVLKGINP